MKKNRIMRYLAAAFAAVLITTSTIPTYAEVIEDTATVQEETDTVQLSDDDVHVGVSNEQKVADTTVTEPVTEDSVEDTLLEEDDAANTKEDNIVETDVVEDELEATDEVSEAETEAEEADADDDELFVVSGPVARVVTDDSSSEFYSIESAVSNWNEAGAGATLTLLADIKSSNPITVSGGTETDPLILDLNDHGILYKNTGIHSSVIVIKEESFFKLTDSTGSTRRYLVTDSYGRATGVFSSKKGAMNIEVIGGYIAGGNGSLPNGSLTDYYLGGGIYCSGHFIMDGGTICGNAAFSGANNYGGGVFIESGSFTLNGGMICNNYSNYNGGGVFIDSGSFTLSGGMICNNKALNNGGGVNNKGKFTMTGGKIKDNQAVNDGGGVRNDQSGEFTMIDGEIIENSSKYGGGVSCKKPFTMEGGKIKDNTADISGGGLYFGENISFTMNGGEISDNDSEYYGGGIYAYKGPIEINGGKISGNNARIGGGIEIIEGNLTLKGGEIGNNSAQERGNAVYSDESTVVSIKGNVYVSSYTNGKDGYNANPSEVELFINEYGYLYITPKINGIATVTTGSGEVKPYDEFSDALADWQTAGNGAKLTLLDDVEITDTIFVNGGTQKDPFILDLNGYGILFKGANGNVITVNAGACLELDDTGSKTKRYITIENERGTSVVNTEPGSGDYISVEGGYITGGNDNKDHGAGGIIIAKNDENAYGTFIMNGGTIAANTSANDGSNSAGAVFDDGSFIMNGGSLQKNAGFNGGGVYIYYFASFIMNGGQILDNTALNYGGGVMDAGRFTLKDGSINGNKSLAGTSAGGGGGVYVGTDPNYEFKISGGEIKNNYAKSNGGGICALNGKVTIYSIEIAGNSADDEGKAILDNGGKIDFAGSVYAGDDPDGSKAELVTGDDRYGKVKDKAYVTVLGFHVEPDPVPDMTYTGSAIVPAFKVYNGDTLLKDKTDYTVTLKNNTNVSKSDQDADKAQYTITGKGNFSASIDGTFKIVQKSVSDADVTVAEIASKAAGKTAYKPVPSLTYNKKKLTVNKDFTVKYFNADTSEEVAAPKSAGKYLARVEGGNNFTGTRDVPFRITSSDQVMVSKLTVAKIPDQPYNGGKAIKPAISVKNGRNDVPDNCYDVKYTNNTEIGTATVTITGKEDEGYIGSKSVTFKITGMALSKAKFVDAHAKDKIVYSGAANKKDIDMIYQVSKTESITLNKMDKSWYDQLPAGSSTKRAVDYVISYENNVNAGTATMTMTGVNNWSGSVKKTFKIDKFDIKTNEFNSFKVEQISSEGYPYKKAGVKPVPVVKFSGETLQNGIDYTLSYANNTTVGGAKSPVVKVTGKGNFTGVKEAEFKINKAELDNTFSIAVKDVVWANKKGNYKSAVTVTDADGKKLAANTDYKLVYSQNASGTPELEKNDIVEAGTTIYAVIIADESLPKTPYTGTVNVAYRVCAKDIGKLTATVDDQTYTGRAVTISKSDIKWKSGGKPVENMNDNFEILTDTYEKNINKGTASVYVKGLGDYGCTKKVTFTIKTKAIK